MTQHGLGLHQPHPHVGRLEPVHHLLALLDVVLAGSALGQGHEHLAALNRHDLGELSGADDGVILCDRDLGVDSKVFLTHGVIGGKVLPGCPGHAVILGLLQGPDPGPGGVSHGHHEVGHLEPLEEVDLQVHSVVFPASGDGWRLPPGGDVTVHRAAGAVHLGGVHIVIPEPAGRVAGVTHLAVQDLLVAAVPSLVDSVKSSDKFTEALLADTHALATGGVGGDGSVLCDVEVGRGEHILTPAGAQRQ